MTYTQHYKVKAIPEIIKHAVPGHFVFENDTSDTPIGFIDFVSDCELGIMLFETADKSGFEFINISALADWETRLQEIIDNDPEMRVLWDPFWK